MRYWLIPMAAACTLAMAAAHAQIPDPNTQRPAAQAPTALARAQTPAAAPAPAPQPSPLQIAPVPAPVPAAAQAPPPPKTTAAPAKADKSCIAAGRKLDRERNSLAYAKDETTRYTKASQTCATKSTCARYKAALDSLEKRVARHERRIETFIANRDKACKT